MKIVSLQAENIKRLIAVEIRPDTNLVQITGKNGQGKTSVLDAIWWALTGKSNVQAVPIRKGAERAVIRLDIGEFRITRTFTAKEGGEYTTTITVDTDAGARLASPQDVLNAIVGDLAFDPLEFIRLKPKEQFDLAKAFVPGIDFAALAKEDKDEYDRRTDLNRSVKALRAQAEGIQVPAGQVAQVMDLSALEKQLGEAAEHNTMVERRRNQRQAFIDSIAARKEELADLQERIKGLETQIAEGEKKLKEAEALPDPIDTGKVMSKLEEGRRSNAHAHLAKRRADLNAEAAAAEDEALKLTRSMEKREEDKQKAIAAAKMPVHGLTFSGESVLFQGLPFDQASTSQQLRAGVAIAAALNPRLRVAFIRDGSLLDDDAMSWLQDWADEHDMQVWVERVDPSGSIGFVIEDGMLRGAGSDPAQAAAEEEAI
jgi:DNA repair exonuclease SbcCD ATPase subunit